MAQRSHYSSSTLSAAAGGRIFPSWEVTRAFVLACDGHEREWTDRWNSADREISTSVGAPSEPPAALASGISAGPERGEIDVGIGKKPPNSLPRHWRLITVVTVVAGVVAVALVLGVRAFMVPGRSNFLGQADLAGYCRQESYSGVSLDGPTAYDWRCASSTGQKVSLSVIDACRWQYKSATATARFNDIHVPASWQCWDRVVVLGVVDLQRYCQAQGGARPSLAGQTTDSWSCVSSTGIRTRIDPDVACRWRYGQRVVVVNIGIYDAPWEQWECWG